MAVEKEAFAIFYRPDGDGVPFALVPLQPVPARFCNFYDNWKCLYDFRTASLNQQFVPEQPPVAGCNDTGYLVTLGGRHIAGRGVVFFPNWLGQGGQGRRCATSLSSRAARHLFPLYLRLDRKPTKRQTARPYGFPDRSMRGGLGCRKRW